MNSISTVRVSQANTAKVAEFIATRLRECIDADKRVLWLVSGGSCIQVATRARVLLGELSSDVQIDVALVDERYGNVGHKDSNAEQFIQANFDTQGIAFYPVLCGKSIEATTSDYDDVLMKLVDNADAVLGLFGMGADGHTSGLLPGNPVMSSENFVDYFDGPDFRRITTTPRAIRSVDKAVLFAVGESKWPALEKLEHNVDMSEQPVQLLKEIPSLHIFTDYQKSTS